MTVSFKSNRNCPALTHQQADIIFTQIVQRLHIKNTDWKNRRYFHKIFYKKFILKKACRFTVFFCFYICFSHKINKYMSLKS